MENHLGNVPLPRLISGWFFVTKDLSHETLTSLGDVGSTSCFFSEPSIGLNQPLDAGWWFGIFPLTNGIMIGKCFSRWLLHHQPGCHKSSPVPISTERNGSIEEE